MPSLQLVKDQPRQRDSGDRQVGSGTDQTSRRRPAAGRQAVLPIGGQGPGPHTGWRGPARLQPFGWFDDDRPADIRGGLLRPVRLRPAALHAEPRHALRRADQEVLPAARGHSGQPGKRRPRARRRRRGDGLSRRGLRRDAADAGAKRHRLQRPHRIRADGHRSGRADRADRVDRRTGNAVLPDPRHLACQADRHHQAADPQRARADRSRVSRSG